MLNNTKVWGNSEVLIIHQQPIMVNLRLPSYDKRSHGQRTSDYFIIEYTDFIALLPCKITFLQNSCRKGSDLLEMQ